MFFIRVLSKIEYLRAFKQIFSVVYKYIIIESFSNKFVARIDKTIGKFAVFSGKLRFFNFITELNSQKGGTK